MAELDLQQFCAREDDPRDYLRQPWAHKGWRYGCNGHILVRVPSPADPHAAADHKLAEKARELVERLGQEQEGYIPLPPFPAPRVCLGCSGEGQYLQLRCGDCEGEGHFRHGRHEYECKQCEGEGFVPADDSDKGAVKRDCPECFGIGHQRAPALVGEVHFDVIYLRLLSNLHGLRIRPNGDGGAHFTFDGGEGVLMPRAA